MVSYTSKSWEPMIILIESDVLEFRSTFSCAYGPFGIFLYPFLYQIEAKLKEENKKRKRKNSKPMQLTVIQPESSRKGR